MIRKATKKDKPKVVSILTKAFLENKSVNYLVKQGKNKEARIAAMMDYSFEVCMLSGEVYITEDAKACALIQYLDQKPGWIKSSWLDLKLIFQCVGLGNVIKALKREAKVKSYYPNESTLIYLWFIGVDPVQQGKRIGSNLLSFVIKKGKQKNRAVYLETSTEHNLSWYAKNGFEIYQKIEDFGFPFYFFKWKGQRN